MIQGMEDQVVCTCETESGAFLTAICPSAEQLLAKSILEALHDVDKRVHWNVEIKNGMLFIFTHMHPEFCYSIHLRHLGKGYTAGIRTIGHELLARLEAGYLC